jgi:hypothetical protein
VAVLTLVLWVTSDFDPSETISKQLYSNWALKLRNLAAGSFALGLANAISVEHRSDNGRRSIFADVRLN